MFILPVLVGSNELEKGKEKEREKEKKERGKGERKRRKRVFCTVRYSTAMCVRFSQRLSESTVKE